MTDKVLPYLGPSDTDSSLVTASYVNNRSEFVRVDNAYVDAIVSDRLEIGDTMTTDYVNSQLQGKLTASNVTSQMGAYIPASDLGKKSGIARSDAANQIPLAQLGNLSSDSIVASGNYPAGNEFPAGSPGHNTNWSGRYQTGETKSLLSISVPDPGYPYKLLCTGYFEMQNVNANQRGDVVVRVGSSSSGQVIARGTTPPDGYRHWGACNIVPDGDCPVLTGATTVYAVAITGYGNGYTDVSTFQAHLNAVPIPV